MNDSVAPRRRRPLRIGAAVAAAVLVGVPILDWGMPFPHAALQRAPAVVVTDRAGTPLRMFLPRDQQWRLPVRLADVAPELTRAVVAAEDRWFPWHPGVNPMAVVRALWTNVRSRRVVSGASTIPMQIARLVEPKPRTWPSKLQEAWRALQLRWHYRDDELLQAYLNLAPYGGNVEGVGAAAYFYFGKTAARLSLAEAALLAALPRSPTAYDPTRHPEAARVARDRLLRRLAARGTFPQAAVRAALREPLPAAARHPPLRAPHFSQWVADQLPGVARIDTTLDPTVQAIAEERAAARAAALRRGGIDNVAVVVLENSTRAVRAMVGSAGFFESQYDGQVNGALARRSPGSTLKPFLYALAFDAGRIVPDSYLLDVPTDFGGYVPENFDGEYRGRVTAREALVNSLNAAAVRLEAEVGIDAFHELLLRGGLTTLDRPTAAYGLSLILGSGEVTLLALTNLYATLAEGGVDRPITFQPAAVRAGDPLFSRESAHLTAEILTGLRRPDLPRVWDLARDVPPVAWKTGTSFGHRDAWAVGFSRRYSIGVWVGNFDGRAQKGISGAEHAAPLLFDVFRAIDRDDTPLVTSGTLHLAQAEVCAVSHQLPGPFCHERTTVTYLPGRSQLSTCTYHRRVFVDDASGELLAGDCLATRPHHTDILTVYPAELMAWWRSRGEPVTGLPAVSRACRDIPSADVLRIVSPAAATPYRVRRDAPLQYQQIPLVAHAAASTQRLFWYQDGALITTGAPTARLFVEPRPGGHDIVVVDDAGRLAAASYRVE